MYINYKGVIWTLKVWKRIEYIEILSGYEEEPWFIQDMRI